MHRCGAIVLALSVASAPAFSQDRDFGEHGGYQVFAFEGTSETDQGGCAMAEDDFEGPGGSRLRVYRYVARPDQVAVTVDNYNWSIVKDRDYKVRYDFDEYYYEREATGTVNGIHKGLLAGFPASQFLSTFAKSSRIHIYMGDTVVDKLSLDGSAAGAAAFARCWTYIQADARAKARERARWDSIPKDPFTGAQEGGGPEVARPPVSAVGAIGGLIRHSDYPESAIDRNEQGMVRFRLTIGINGRVEGCAITASSGSSTLDSTTCRIMQSRARFTPAMSESGNPVRGTYDGFANWTLQ